MTLVDSSGWIEFFLDNPRAATFEKYVAQTEFAAELSLKHKLGTADAVVYATALAHDAKLVTLDNDFRDLPHCIFIE